MMIGMKHIQGNFGNINIFMSSEGLIIEAPVFLTQKQVDEFDLYVRSSFDSWKKRCSQKEIPQRLIFCQLCLPATEWEILENHEILVGSSGGPQRSVLNIPTQHFYLPKERPQASEFLLRDMEQLTHNYNYEAYSLYCSWIGEQMKDVLAHIPLEALELYTLEACLKNFVHEQESLLLGRAESNCRRVHQRLGALRKLLPTPQENRHENELELQKELMRSRSEIHKSLQVRYNLLVDMISLIPSKETLVPQLQELTLQVQLLELSMRKAFGGDHQNLGWLPQIILTQLLHEALGVITIVQADAAKDRVAWASAIMAAVASLREKFSAESFKEVFIRWMDTELSTEHRSSRQAVKEELAKQVLMLLMKRSGISFLSLNKKNDLKNMASYEVNAEFLEAIPLTEEFLVDEKLKEAELVIVDSHGKPLDLTQRGHQLMFPWFENASRLP